MAGFVVAVTGGVASGKSAVTALFASLGIEIVDADEIARAIVARGQPALLQIGARFGAGILLADGSLNRAALRQRIFDDPASRRDLEAITHPRIRQRLHAACRAAPGPYAIAAIPLLAETGSAAYAWVERVLVVDTSVALQQSRLMQRDGANAELASKMISSQASREQRLALATDVIVNDAGMVPLGESVHRLDTLFRRLSAAVD